MDSAAAGDLTSVGDPFSSFRAKKPPIGRSTDGDGGKLVERGESGESGEVGDDSMSTSSADRSVRAQLAPIWNKVGTKSRQLVSDLRTLQVTPPPH